MAKEHIVKSYDDELIQLKSKVVDMGRGTARQLRRAVAALIKRDTELVNDIISRDVKVNSMQIEVDSLTVRMLATRQPMAIDLRSIIAGLKIAADLERIADYAANVARHVPELNHISLEMPVKSITSMAELAQRMLNDILDAYEKFDVEKAIAVWHRDGEIDRRYADLLGQLRFFMTHDSENVSAYTSLLFVARCFERIGDHITNIAENIYFIEHSIPYSVTR